MQGSTSEPTLERSVHPRALPDELYIEVTNRCNLRCTTCPQSWGMPEGSADFSPARVAELLEQLPVIRRVVLHGIGEPTLSPHLPEIIRMVKARGAYALFNTNGLLLRGRLLRELLDSGLDEIRVSVDAATPETYREVRGANGFARIIQNVTVLTALRNSENRLTPRVSLWMTGMRTNIEELPALVRVAHDSGITEVYLQRLVFSQRGNATEENALYGRLSEAEKSSLAEAERLATELGIALRGSSEALPPANAPSVDGAPWRGCRRPWSLMYITANGNALPCCIAPFTEAPYAGLVQGNVFQVPIAEVWDGARYQDWRARMLEGEPPAACKGCGSDWAL